MSGQADGRVSPPPPGKPPLQLKRFLIRLGLLIVVIWGSPILLLVLIQISSTSYGMLAIPAFICFAALCHVLGRLVGRFERDAPVQYGVGCSWPYWLFGVLSLVGRSLSIILFAAGAVLFIAGFTGAKKSVGRRVKLLAEGKCFFCEYDLAGLGDSGVCPECGQKFSRGAP